MEFERTPVLGKTYRNFRRYREIISVFFKYGFGEMIYSLNLNRILDPVLKRESTAREIRQAPRPKRLRMALEDLGSSFVKFGQILASRPDLLPMEYIEELQKLEDNVPPVDFDRIKVILEEEIGCPLEQAFKEFNETPIAAASIAQIYDAILPGGEQVVVKVQRPGLWSQVEIDLEILENLAGLLENRVEGWKVHRPSHLIQQIGRMLIRELDYTVELAYIDRFRHHLADDPNLVIPRTYDDLSTSKVIVMEKVVGLKASHRQPLLTAGYDVKKVAHRVAHSVMTQIFTHGFFHADPHAGNLFILPEEKICFIDFGMMGTMNREMRDHFADLLYGIAQRDEHLAALALISLTDPEHRPDRRSLEIDIAEFMTQHFYRPLKNMKIGRLLNELVTHTTQHGLRIPIELFILIKSVSTVESVVRKLDPDFDLIAEVTPHVRQVRLNRYRPGRIAQTLSETGSSLFTLMRFLPVEINNFFRSLEKGKARIAFEHHGLQPLIEHLDQLSNRISFAIVLAALILGSSLIIHARIPPYWNDISVIGLFGYSFAGIMGIWLLYSIIRHGKL